MKLNLKPKDFGYEPKPIEMDTRPGAASDYLIPSMLWQELEESRAGSRKLVKKAAKSRSWSEALADGEMVDFSNSTDPIIILMPRALNFGRLIYLHDTIFDMHKALLHHPRGTPEDFELYRDLVREGSRHLWFAIAMMWAPVGFGPICPFPEGWQHVAIREFLVSMMRWWDHIAWLGDRIVTPSGPADRPMWKSAPVGLMMILGTSEEEARKIEWMSPSQAKAHVDACLRKLK